MQRVYFVVESLLHFQLLVMVEVMLDPLLPAEVAIVEDTLLHQPSLVTVEVKVE